MIIGYAVDSVGLSDNLAKPIIGKTKQDTPFADVLERIEKGIEEAESAPFRASRYLEFPKMKRVEERPVCIVCGMTISSEGTCLCAYPTVISNHGSVSLNRNSSAQVGNTQSVGEGKMTRLSENREARDTEKVKLRRRCLICGSAVSDDGSCMCAEEDDSKTNVKVPKIQINLSRN